MSMFLPLTVSKLTQQGLRGCWGGGMWKKNKNKNPDKLTITQQLLITASAVFICGKVSRKGKLFPTQSSRSRLDKLPIEVGDDCIALLCCVHPDGGEDETTTKTHHQVTQRSSKVQSSLTQWCWHDWNNSDSHFCDHLHSVGFIANNRHRYVKWNRRQYRVICPVIDDCFGFCTVTPDSGGTQTTQTQPVCFVFAVTDSSVMQKHVLHRQWAKTDSI